MRPASRRRTSRPTPASDCHTTTAWTPARFDHASITGSCASCHNGSRATGKPTSHFITSRDCVDCHTTVAWSPVNYVHTSAAFPAGHRQTFSCSSCHIGNAELNAWKTAAYKPDCAGCHASDFSAGAHRKVDSPRVNYTVSELRDCTGACHTYTDNTLTTIKNSRTGHHRVSQGSWD